VRFSAISIEAGAQLFRTLAEMLREEERKARNAGRYPLFAREMRSFCQIK